MHPGQMKQ
jgi:hypothetical protein